MTGDSVRRQKGTGDDRRRQEMTGVDDSRYDTSELGLMQGNLSMPCWKPDGEGWNAPGKPARGPGTCLKGSLGSCAFRRIVAPCSPSWPPSISPPGLQSPVQQPAYPASHLARGRRKKRDVLCFRLCTSRVNERLTSDHVRVCLCAQMNREKTSFRLCVLRHVRHVRERFAPVFGSKRSPNMDQTRPSSSPKRAQTSPKR